MTDDDTPPEVGDLRQVLVDRPDHLVVDGILQLERIEVDGADLAGLDLRQVAFLDCRLRDVSFAGADLRAVRFDGSYLERVTFDRTHLEDCYLQRAELVACDLRRTVATRTSFDRSTLRHCDLYRFQAHGDVGLGRARLIAPSLHRADLSGSDIRWASIVDGLAHESPVALASMHDSAEDLQSDPDKRRSAEAHRLDDAIDTYRTLSGLFSDRGQYADAGNAYLRAKQLERTRDWRIAGAGAGAGAERLRRGGSAFGSWVADVVCGYGERLWRVAATLFVVGVSQGVALLLVGGVEVRGAPIGAVEGFAVSFLGLIGREPPETEIVSAAAQLVTAMGTGSGIALVGLFGFVLGNKIRFS